MIVQYFPTETYNYSFQVYNASQLRNQSSVVYHLTSYVIGRGRQPYANTSDLDQSWCIMNTL